MSCNLCGRALTGYAHHIKVGEVHDDCMVAFYFGISFKQPDGTVVEHNADTCGLCEVQKGAQP